MSRPGWLFLTAALFTALSSTVVWQRESVAADGSASAAPNGAALFWTKGCAACHDGPDSSALTGGLPSLAEASTWAGDRRPNLNAAEYLSESINDPGAFMSPLFVPGSSGPTNAMPSLDLSEVEVAAVVEYLLAG